MRNDEDGLGTSPAMTARQGRTGHLFLFLFRLSQSVRPFYSFFFSFGPYFSDLHRFVVSLIFSLIAAVCAALEIDGKGCFAEADFIAHGVDGWVSLWCTGCLFMAGHMIMVVVCFDVDQWMGSAVWSLIVICRFGLLISVMVREGFVNGLW